MSTLHLTEAAEPLAPVSSPTRQADGSLKFLARIIEADRWGSSAYYEAAPLRRDAAVFRAGLQMYVDHPSASEKWDRPERSIRDLGGKLAEAATFRDAFTDEAGKPQPAGLYAPVVVNPASADLIESMWDQIGLSIRAEAEADPGTREGRTGHIVTKFVEATSVDFVTRAGAGGELISLMESHRAAAAVPRTALAEALPGGLTFDDLRSALRELVRALIGEANAYAELEDFTDTEVIFRVVDWSGATSARSTWRQTYAAADTGGLSLTGDPVQVRQVTTYVDVPADDPAATELPTSPRTTTVVGTEAAAVTEASTTPSTTAAGGTPVGQINVEESEHAALLKDRERLQVVEARLARRDATDVARPIVTKLVAESTTLPASWQTDLVEESLREVPMTSDLKLDETALRSLVEAARTREERKVAALREANGEGKVTGLGGGTTPAGTSVQESAGGSGGDTGGTVMTEESYRDQILAAAGKKRRSA